MDQGWIVLIVIGVAIWIVVKFVRYMLRRSALIEKYGRDIGLKILARKLWQGMSEEQLKDSWGRPVETEHMVYKTKTKETWKYNRTGKNRFEYRIYLEDSTVVGWKD